MIIYPDTKIEAASDPKHVTPCLTDPYLDLEHSAIVATQGHILAVLPVTVDGDGDTPGPVPAAALKAARSRSNKRDDGMRALTLNGKASTSDSDHARADAGTFPDWQRVIPAPESAGFTVCLDARLIARLADALHDRGNGPQGLRFTFQETDGKPDGTLAIKVEPVGKTAGVEDRIGVIMPMAD